MAEIKTKKNLLDYLTKMAIEYAPECKESIQRNKHMNDIGDLGPYLHPNQINAILVDFVNYIGNHQGLDWGLHTKDLKDE